MRPIHHGKDTEVKRQGWIRCTVADNPDRMVGITKEQIAHLFARTGGYREQHRLIGHMEVEILDNGKRNNIISVFDTRGEHIADIAYREWNNEQWFICG